MAYSEEKRVMKAQAMKAVHQINKQQYQKKLNKYWYLTEIVCIGLAFHQKNVVGAYSVHDLVAHCETEIALAKA
jgi:hypothetical protein